MDTPVSEEWIEAATRDEFAEVDRKEVTVGDHSIGIFKLDENEYAAITIWCSHQRMSLMTGEVDDGTIMCPLHGARFDLRTGQQLSLPAVKPIETYEVKVDGDHIYVKV